MGRGVIAFILSEKNERHDSFFNSTTVWLEWSDRQVILTVDLA